MGVRSPEGHSCPLPKEPASMPARVRARTRTLTVAAATAALAAVTAAVPAHATAPGPHAAAPTTLFTPPANPDANAQILDLLKHRQLKDAAGLLAMTTTPPAVWFDGGTSP